MLEQATVVCEYFAMSCWVRSYTRIWYWAVTHKLSIWITLPQILYLINLMMQMTTSSEIISSSASSSCCQLSNCHVNKPREITSAAAAIRHLLLELNPNASVWVFAAAAEVKGYWGSHGQKWPHNLNCWNKICWNNDCKIWSGSRQARILKTC